MVLKQELFVRCTFIWANVNKTDPVAVEFVLFFNRKVGPMQIIAESTAPSTVHVRPHTASSIPAINNNAAP
ncbi:MAG: hypothetical protein IPH00_11625 [Flavobacteriales bacterium]|nr:hypothetical protein [Flavobacteriales bacterium]